MTDVDFIHWSQHFRNSLTMLHYMICWCCLRVALMLTSQRTSSTKNINALENFFFSTKIHTHSIWITCNLCRIQWKDLTVVFSEFQTKEMTQCFMYCIELVRRDLMMQRVIEVRLMTILFTIYLWCGI